MKERATKEMFEIYMKYASEYGVNTDEQNLIEMWNDDIDWDEKDVEYVKTMQIGYIELVEGINAENLTTEEKIYIAFKIGMLM